MMGRVKLICVHIVYQFLQWMFYFTYWLNNHVVRMYHWSIGKVMDIRRKQGIRPDDTFLDYFRKRRMENKDGTTSDTNASDV